MVIVSCISKFHSFNLAEQLQRQDQLTRLYTSYSYHKNKSVRSFVKRIDKEKIDQNRIETNLFLAAFLKFGKNQFKSIEYFDKWVAKQLEKEKKAKVFIGWSGMSLRSISKAKERGLLSILERGSCHIEYQIEILEEEYKKFGKVFPRDQRIMDKEYQEYELADIISVPSQFAANSFYERGFSKEKIWINNFGSSSHFQLSDDDLPPLKPFRILYVGNLSIQKGVKYLFDALDQLPVKEYELWLIGTITKELENYIKKNKKDNWKIFGFVNHYRLPQLIQQCHVAIQPSLQEGLSMVIPQYLSCGLPVIATTNTGGEDIISKGENGFIIPIRNSQEILEKILFYRENPDILHRLRKKMNSTNEQYRTWEDYGEEYLEKINIQLNQPSLI